MRHTSAPPAADPRRALGDHGEQHACRHLERRGYRIVARQARTRFGEIDIIAGDDSTLVFCEVKTRIARGGVVPWTSLHHDKRMRVRRLATAWLAEHSDRPRAEEIRFDAILVVLDRDHRLRSLEHLEAAF